MGGGDRPAEPQYEPFPGICLTDTFELFEKDRKGYTSTAFFEQNNERIDAQRKSPITVIVGNPPYSAGQKSANDNAQNQTYRKLEDRIAETYAAHSNATNKNALYDSYIKAFRFAADRLPEEKGGIIAFVTNGGWLKSNTMDGFRKCLAKDFDKIYVLDLRGDQRTSGELSRREGGKIFGSGSRASISVTFLIRYDSSDTRKQTQGCTAELFYYDIGDYLSREEKLKQVALFKSVAHPDMAWQQISPNEYGDWFNARNEDFYALTPIAPEKKFTDSEAFFTAYSLGIGSSRAAWVYNFSQKALQANVQKTIAFYNEQRLTCGGSREAKTDPKRGNWASSWCNYLKQGREIKEKPEEYRLGMYRPFTKMPNYFGEELIHRRFQQAKFFPSQEHKNLLICTHGTGGKADFSCLITDLVPDQDLLSKTQTFPLYWYEEVQAQKGDDQQTKLFAEGFAECGTEKTSERYTRHDGVSDYSLSEMRKIYKDEAISKEDIFYYVYGLLHSEDYRHAYNNDLKRLLARIPIVATDKDFWTFSDTGRALAELHLSYDTFDGKQPTPSRNGEGTLLFKDSPRLHVEKMRFGKKPSPSKDGKNINDKSIIHYNESVAIEGIPMEAYDYVVNGKSAIEWVMDRYQVRTDKNSGIINDPNLWCKERGQPYYIINLLLSVIHVSLETRRLVRSLPQLDTVV